MKTTEGLPFVKLMMLISSMAPLFILVGVRGMDKVICDNYLWITISCLVIIPYLILRLRIYGAVKSDDTFVIDISEAKNNKEYLFTYLFTVLLPLYSIEITSPRGFSAMLVAIALVIFVLWNMNLHFINIFFAIRGYRVYTIDDSSFNSSILLTRRTRIPNNLKKIKVHRLSNTVFIELNNHSYDN